MLMLKTIEKQDDALIPILKMDSYKNGYFNYRVILKHKCGNMLKDPCNTDRRAHNQDGHTLFFVD